MIPLSKNEENSIMIGYLLSVINLTFKTNNEFYSFATSIDFDNKINDWENIKTDDYPTVEKMISRYKNKLNQKLKSKKIKSYCIAIDVLSSRETNIEKTNSIAFLIKNSISKKSEVLYYLLYPKKQNK